MAQLHETLQQLSALTKTEAPLLSMYVNWVPDGNGKRPQVRLLEQQLEAFSATYAGNAEYREGFESDRQRILDYVNNDAPQDARGLAIFACAATNLWEALPLQAQVDNEFVDDHYPHLFQLARLLDNYETTAVVVTTAQEARIMLMTLDQLDEVATSAASEEIKRFQSGGPDQPQMQRRTDNLIKAHMKDIGTELERLSQRYNIQHVVFAGNDAIKGIVLEALPDQVKAKMIDYINFDPNGSLKDLRAVVEPMVQEAERKQEQHDLTVFADQMASKGGLAAGGPEAVAMALSKGQVLTLLMHDGFNAQGSECPTCGSVFGTVTAECPYDGSHTQPLDLREAFVARAVSQGSNLQIVEDSAALSQYSGVGAVLRYRDDEQAIGGQNYRAERV